MADIPDRIWRIRLHGQEWLFFGARGDDDVPIATAEQYRTGEVSYAQLQRRIVWRYHEPIATEAEIEWLEEVPCPTPDSGALERILEQWLDVIFPGPRIH